MSDPSVVRQRFSDLDLVEVDDADTEHDEFKPLSPSPQNGRRKVSFNISSSSGKRNPAQERDEEVSCFGDLWKLIGSLALTLLLILPFLHSLYQYKQGLGVAHSGDIPSYPSDQLQCANDYNISFALLHRQIQLATDYCDTPPGMDGGDGGGRRSEVECTCANPLEPIAHVPLTPKYISKWDATHARNAKWASGTTRSDQAAPSTQVVLYGDSIVEHFAGTDLGDITQETMSVKKQFDLVFDGKALALGLAGDRCPQMLYRLQHGELSSSLDPAVIWLLIGTNDQADHCSQEAILMGIINIAQYLQEQRPNATLVINGILPKPNPTSRKWKGTKYYNSVTWINQRLACYAKGLDRVEYFDPEFLFVDEEGLIPVDLVPDGIHPSGKGSRIWAEAMLQRIDEIMDQYQH